MDVKREAVSLDNLLDRVRRGEEVELTENGRVIARLVPVAPPTPAEERAERERIAALRRSAFGMYGDKVWIAEDAFEPDEDLIDSFYADNIFPKLPDEGGRG